MNVGSWIDQGKVKVQKNEQTKKPKTNFTIMS